MHGAASYPATPGTLTRCGVGRVCINARLGRRREDGARRDAILGDPPLRLRPGGTLLQASCAAKPKEVEASNAAGDLQLLDQDNYHDFIASQGDALVVVDFYSDWCGPCKLVLPELVKMAAYYHDVRFVKYRVTSENKAIADELGIRVAPTFVLYRSTVKLDELKGAKVARLKKLIQAYRK